MTKQDAEIIDRAKKRIPPYLIAKDLKVSRDRVYSIIRPARTNGEDIPYFSAGRKTDQDRPAPSAQHVVLPPRLIGLLKSYGEGRGLTPSEAARHLLETAILNT